MNDVVLPVVPMFHANAWGLPHACAAVGAKMVFPGPKLDPESLLDLMAKERVTCAGGVPTIWLGHPRSPRCAPEEVGPLVAPADGRRRLGRAGVDDGGLREAPRLDRHPRLGHDRDEPPRHDRARQARPRRTARTRSASACARRRGCAVPFVETRHADDAGKVLPWDGETMGELEVRGPWVAASYMGGRGRRPLDARRLVQDRRRRDDRRRRGTSGSRDRSKDVIKSGGEWISSVDLENALMAHPAVLEAAVFAGRHPKWDERPIAAIVLKKGMTATEADLQAHLDGQVRQVLASGRLCLPRADPADVDRQVPEEQAPGDVRGHAGRRRVAAK